MSRKRRKSNTHGYRYNLIYNLQSDMRKNELIIPKPELIIVEDHPLSLQVIGEKLPLWNATQYAEAMDIAAVSESGKPMHGQEYHIKEANRISKFGRGLLAVGVFDNKTANPGNPASLRGFMYAGLESVKQFGVGVNGGRIPNFFVEVPSLFNGPVVAREYKPDPEEEEIEQLSPESRYMIKLELTRFAVKTFTSDQLRRDNLSVGSIRVNTTSQDIEGIEALKTLGAKQQDFLSATKADSKHWQEAKVHELTHPFKAT